MFQKKKDEIDFLVKTIIDDSMIKQRITELLDMSPFKRRSVLNIWLEKLKMKNAPVELQQAIFLMFDDSIAEKVLKRIKKINQDGYSLKI